MSLIDFCNLQQTKLYIERHLIIPLYIYIYLEREREERKREGERVRERESHPMMLKGSNNSIQNLLHQVLIIYKVKTETIMTYLLPNSTAVQN